MVRKNSIDDPFRGKKNHVIEMMVAKNEIRRHADDTFSFATSFSNKINFMRKLCSKNISAYFLKQGYLIFV